MKTEYKISTLNDIMEKVPADRIQDCLKELGTLMASTKAYSELLHETAVHLAKQDGKTIPEYDPTGYLFTLPMTWIDDGRGELTTNFTANGKPFTSIKITNES